MDDRSRLRRAALRRALRVGDVVGTARAWERLRADPSGLSRDQLTAARAARLALGRAIRNARWRRAAGVEPARRIDMVAAGAARATPLRRAMVVALAVALVVIGILLWPHEEPGGSPAGAAPDPQAQTTTTTQTFSGARGRTSATLPPVVAVTPQPTVAPTAEPTAAPATPAPTTGTGSGGAVGGGSGQGGSGGGSGSGSGSGSGGGGTPTPAPTPSPTPEIKVVAEGPPPPKQPGWDRITFHVFDSQTRQPLAGVCVSYGTGCGPEDYHTNSLGYYWLDLQPPAASLWSFRFVFNGYFTATTQIRYERGQSRSVDIYLRRR